MTLSESWIETFRRAEEIDRANGVAPLAAVPAVEPEGTTESTWSPIPLGRLLAGDYRPPVASMLTRSDGSGLLYAGKVHSFNAEPEALKTWLALGAATERMAAGEPVVYIDFEDSAPTIVGRLLALGVAPETIDRLFLYIRPDGPLTPQALADLDRALKVEPKLSIIDGITEAFAQQGLNPESNSDVAHWQNLLPRRITLAGSAVMQLDHVVKDKEARGRYGIGAQHKLAGVDVSYGLTVVQPFGHGREGVVHVHIKKDRPGAVRGIADDDGHVAVMRAQSDGAAVCLRLDPPDATKAAVQFRPTYLMQKASEAIENDPGIGVRELRAALTGQNNDAKALAVQLLIAEGYVQRRQEGHTAAHHSIRKYRAADEGASVPKGAQYVPGTFPDEGAVVPPPLKGAEAPLRHRRSHPPNDQSSGTLGGDK